MSTFLIRAKKTNLTLSISALILLAFGSSACPSACPSQSGNAVISKFESSLPDYARTHYLLGFRSPGTGLGKAQEKPAAYVAARVRGEIVAARFADGDDYIVHPSSWDEVIQEASSLFEKGWLSMSLEDIKDTSGMDSSETDKRE